MGALTFFLISLLCSVLRFVSMAVEENGYFAIQYGQVPYKFCVLNEITVENNSSPLISCGVECNKNQNCIGMDLIKVGRNVCRLLSGFVTIIPSISTVDQCTRYQKIIQRRLDGSVNFKQDWTQYQRGFGSRDSEFWIGNENIYHLTNEGYTHLRNEMMDHDCVWKYAEYNTFYIEGATSEYRLHVSGYSGDAGDSFIYHNNMFFSTHDNDNDGTYSFNCAILRHGAWWYNNCHRSNLNGEYGNTDNSDGINWYTWKGFYYSMKEVRMMIRKP